MRTLLSSTVRPVVPFYLPQPTSLLLPMTPSTLSPIPVRRVVSRSPLTSDRGSMDGLLGVPTPTVTPTPAGASNRTSWRDVAAVAIVALAAAVALGVTTATVHRHAVAGAVTADNHDASSRGGGPEAVRVVELPRVIRGHNLDCSNGNYSLTTLKLVTELPVVRLISNRPTGEVGEVGASALSSFEVSDLAGMTNGSDLFVVFDNTFRIGHFYGGLSYEAPAARGGEGAGGSGTNRLLTWPGDDGSESEFEVLAYNATSGTYLIIQESVVNASGSLVPRVLEVSLTNTSAVVHSTCDGALTFSSENKGFEGAAVATAADGTSYLLGLCEGNYCGSGDTGRTPGGGRLVAMAREETPGGGCAWVPHQTVALPLAANFQDFSAISIYNNSRVAVTSQENAAVWIGELHILDGSLLSPGHTHWVNGSVAGGPGGSAAGERALFGLSGGKVYDFPRNSQCERIYCNVEVRRDGRT